MGAAVVAEIAPSRLAARGMTTREAMGAMEDLRFRAARIPNEYSVRAYALERWTAPQPLAADPTSEVDVVFLKG